MQLARHASMWAKTLDAELTMEDGRDPPDVQKVSRELQVQVSDATALPQEEDGISCATTETWDISAKASRIPRHRPGRRARRRARLIEQSTVTRLLASSVDDELDYDLGRVPLRSIGALAACLASDEEEETSCYSGLDKSDFFLDNIEEVEPAEVPLRSAAWHGVQNCMHGRLSCGLKRKLEDVDFENLGRACEAQEEARVEAAATACIEKCKQFSVPAFLAQIRIILHDFLHIFGGHHPSTHEEIQSLQASVRDRYDKLKRLIQVPICIDKVAQVVELVRHEITEREALSSTSTSQGMGNWYKDLCNAASTWDEWGISDRELFVCGLEDNMEEQFSIVTYCLETLQDILAGEYVSCY